MTSKTYTASDDPLTYAIIGCAMRVHRELGPGLLESAYEECLSRSMSKSGLSIERQPRVKISYEGTILHREYRPDFVVQDEVVVEVKSVGGFLPVHQAQLLTYMKLAEIESGLLINFNVALLKDGIKRMIMTKAPNGASVSSVSSVSSE
jgi:GxxExxY protein